jgi:glutathione S-transferase
VLTLYLSPRTSSMAAHIALREIGAPFEVQLRSLERKENRQPDFLAINPEGKVPTLLADGEVITEVAAILLYLARRFPEAGLIPTDDLIAEGKIVSWMSFLAARAHPAWRGGGEEALAVYRFAEDRLAASGWAVGDRFSIADIHLFRLFWRFHESAALAPEAFPRLFAHHARMLARPAVQKTLEAEAALP